MNKEIGQAVYKTMNGDKWRILTPIILCILSILSSFNIWLLNNMNASILNNTQQIIKNREDNWSHIKDPMIHYNLKSDIEWLKTFLVNQMKDPK